MSSDCCTVKCQRKGVRSMRSTQVASIEHLQSSSFVRYESVSRQLTMTPRENSRTLHVVLPEVTFDFVCVVPEIGKVGKQFIDP